MSQWHTQIVLSRTHVVCRERSHSNALHRVFKTAIIVAAIHHHRRRCRWLRVESLSSFHFIVIRQFCFHYFLLFAWLVVFRANRILLGMALRWLSVPLHMHAHNPHLFYSSTRLFLTAFIVRFCFSSFFFAFRVLEFEQFIVTFKSLLCNDMSSTAIVVNLFSEASQYQMEFNIFSVFGTICTEKMQFQISFSFVPDSISRILDSNKKFCKKTVSLTVLLTYLLQLL